MIIGKIIMYWINRSSIALKEGQIREIQKCGGITRYLWKDQANGRHIFWEWLKRTEIIESEYGNRSTVV